MRTLSILLPLAVFIVGLSYGQYAWFHCHRALSCIGQPLTLAYHYEMFGYKAGSGRTTSYSGAGYLNCAGSLACNGMNSIVISSAQYISCSGTSSCGDTSIETPRMLCYGLNSCESSTVHLFGDLVCSGSYSCKQLTVSVVTASTISADGYLALSQATIDTSSSTLNVTLSASLAGYNATVVCGSDDTCHIHCHATDACLLLSCLGDGNCLHYGVPNATNSQRYIHEFLFPIAFPTPRTDTLCSLSGVVFDEGATATTPVTVNETQRLLTNESFLCCRGVSSCVALGHDSADPFVIPFSGASAQIICSGNPACSGERVRSVANVFCEGYNACYRMLMQLADSVLCLGRQSCIYASISETNRVVCAGQMSCLNATITSSDSGDLDVFFTGAHDASSSVNITCAGSRGSNVCRVYCMAFESCSGVTLTCNNNCMVECDEQWSGCPRGVWQTTTTVNPTSSPTGFPTDVPSADPTVDASVVSTFGLVAMTTAFVASTLSGTQSRSMSSQSTRMLVIIISCGAVVVCMAMAWIIWCICAGKRHQQGEEALEERTKNVEMTCSGQEVSDKHTKRHTRMHTIQEACHVELGAEGPSDEKEGGALEDTEEQYWQVEGAVLTSALPNNDRASISVEELFEEQTHLTSPGMQTATQQH